MRDELTMHNAQQSGMITMKALPDGSHIITLWDGWKGTLDKLADRVWLDGELTPEQKNDLRSFMAAAKHRADEWRDSK